MHPYVSYILLKKTVVRYRMHWKQFLLAAGINGCINALFLFLAGAILSPLFLIVGKRTPVAFLITILFIIIVLILQFWQILAFLLLLVKKQTLKDAYAHALKNLIPFLGVICLIALTVLGGAVLFILPGILCLIWFSFAIFLFVEGGERGKAALLHSKKIVEGYTYPVLAQLGVISFLFLLFALLLSVFRLGIFALFPQQVLLQGVVLYLFLLYKNVRKEKKL